MEGGDGGGLGDSLFVHCGYVALGKKRDSSKQVYLLCSDSGPSGPPPPPPPRNELERQPGR